MMEGSFVVGDVSVYFINLQCIKNKLPFQPVVSTMCVLCCRSNLLGTQFTVFDGGDSPKNHGSDTSNLRCEMAAAVYVRIPILSEFKFLCNNYNGEIMSKSICLMSAL